VGLPRPPGLSAPANVYFKRIVVLWWVISITTHILLAISAENSALTASQYHASADKISFRLFLEGEPLLPPGSLDMTGRIKYLVELSTAVACGPTIWSLTLRLNRAKQQDNLNRQTVVLLQNFFFQDEVVISQIFLLLS
jgi:hypothetical protein